MKGRTAASLAIAMAVAAYLACDDVTRDQVGSGTSAAGAAGKGSAAANTSSAGSPGAAGRSGGSPAAGAPNAGAAGVPASKGGANAAGVGGTGGVPDAGGNAGSGGGVAGVNAAGSSPLAGAAGANAGASQSGASGTPSSPWPGWSYPGAGDGGVCPLYRPDDLSLVEPLTFVPCATGAPGCKSLMPSWTTTHVDKFNLTRVVRTSDGHDVLFLVETRGDHDYLAGFFDLSNGGAPIAAWRSQMGCWSTLPSWNDTVLAIHLTPNGPHFVDVFWGTPQQLSAATTPKFGFALGDPNFGGDFQEGHLGDGYLAWLGGGTRVMDMSTLAQTLVTYPDAGSWDILGFVGSDLLYVDSEGSYPVSVRHANGVEENLVVVSDGRVVDVDSDGTRLAWLHAYDPNPAQPGTYLKCELWTSAYPLSGPPLAPKRLGSSSPCAALGGAGALMVHGHSVGLGAFPPVVYDLQDGSYRVAPPPTTSTDPLSGYGNLLWADDNEVIAEVLDQGAKSSIAVIDLTQQPVLPAEP